MSVTVTKSGQNLLKPLNSHFGLRLFEAQEQIAAAVFLLAKSEMLFDVPARAGHTVPIQGAAPLKSLTDLEVAAPYFKSNHPVCWELLLEFSRRMTFEHQLRVFYAHFRAIRNGGCNEGIAADNGAFANNRLAA